MKNQLKFNLDRKDKVTVAVIDIFGNRVYNKKLMNSEGVYDHERKRGRQLYFAN